MKIINITMLDENINGERDHGNLCSVVLSDSISLDQVREKINKLWDKFIENKTYTEIVFYNPDQDRKEEFVKLLSQEGFTVLDFDELELVAPEQTEEEADEWEDQDA